MSTSPIKTTGTLKIKKPKEEPQNLRYIDRKGRYLLQERIGDRWRDVPLVGSESYEVAT